MRKTAFILVLVALSALAGDRMGNGGDVRRYRVHRSIEYIISVLMEQNGDPSNSPGSDWLRRYGDFGLRTSMETANVVWVDHHPEGPRFGFCLNLITTAKDRFTFEFSYGACPVRAAPDEYVDMMVHDLFAKYSSEPQLQERVDAFHQVAAAQKAHTIQNGGSSTTAHARRPIPESALGDADQMAGYLAEARDVAVAQIEYKRDFSLAQMQQFFGKAAGQLIFDNNARLIDELKNSPVDWKADQLSCSFTEDRSHAPFELALGKCREIKSIWDLAWLITHESVHHLGVTDENLADSVANEMLSLGRWYETE